MVSSLYVEVEVLGEISTILKDGEDLEIIVNF